MLRSITARLMASYLILAGLVLGLVTLGLVFFLLRNPLVERQLTQRLLWTASAIALREGRGIASLRPERLAALAGKLDQQVNARVLVLGPDLAILADSRKDEELPPGKIMQEAVQSTETVQGDYRDTTGARWSYVAQPIEGGLGVILASPRRPLRGITMFGDELLGPVFQAAGAALLISGLLAWVVAQWIASPLRRLAQAARKVAAGDYDARLPISGPDEMQSVARTFNEMVGRVQASQRSQRDFVANVSHELKTPLTSIQGYAQAILDGTARDPETLETAGRVILEETERLRRLVEGLLDLARLESGQLAFTWAPVDLRALARSVSERMAIRAVEKGIRLTTDVPTLPPVIGDGDRLAQVLTNLLDNAFNHTPADGGVEMRAGTRPSGVWIEVVDSGPGIPPDELPRIFERFYQVDKSRRGGGGRGAGLGLAISREVAIAHGGTLTAESIVGRGSCFRLELPLARPSERTLPGLRKTV
jgi:signal transduction histidine kinase